MRRAEITTLWRLLRAATAWLVTAYIPENRHCTMHLRINRR
jgi:hypothetical protein